MRPESTLTELNAESNRQFKKLELERLRGTQGRAGEDAVVDTELRPLLNIHRFDPEEQETCQIGLHYSAEGGPYVEESHRPVPVEIIQRNRKRRDIDPRLSAHPDLRECSRLKAERSEEHTSELQSHSFISYAV